LGAQIAAFSRIRQMVVTYKKTPETPAGCKELPVE